MNKAIKISALKNELKQYLNSMERTLQMIDEQPNNKIYIELMDIYTTTYKSKLAEFIKLKQYNSQVGR